MISFWRALGIGAVVFVLASTSYGGQTLFLFGGGAKPESAIRAFAKAANAATSSKKSPQILVVTWATGSPQETFEAFQQDLTPFAPQAQFLHGETPQTMGKQSFLKLLDQSTAVFFTGGDQNRIMDILIDSALLQALRNKYQSGIPFGGTSAGTAIMPATMLTGDADMTVIDAQTVKTRGGLGLLPNVLLDQHFIKRQRENRLFALALETPGTLAMGIDEGMAVEVTDNVEARVHGPTQVMLIRGKADKKTLSVELKKDAEKFLLQ